MLSRRNIRLKAVHVLYGLDRAGLTNTAEAPTEVCRTLDSYLRQSELILCFLIDLCYQVAQYSFHDTSYRKLLRARTVLDPPITPPRLTKNAFIASLHRQKEQFIRTAAKSGQHNIYAIRDEDIIKAIFYQLKKDPIYTEYLSAQPLTPAHERRVVVSMIQHIMNNEVIEAHVEHHFIMAYEDAPEVLHFLHKQINTYTPENLCIFSTRNNVDFAYTISKYFLKHRSECFGLILPKIKNWEQDRLCVLDKLLLELSLCEFLYCDNVPARVTINEYIEIAKEYSTEKSGNFINGILDSLYKELSHQKRIAVSKL